MKAMLPVLGAVLLILAGGAIGCGPAPIADGPAGPDGPLRVVDGGVDPAPLLNPVAKKAAAAGAGALQPVGAAVLGEGDQVGSFVEVPQGECMLALARAGRSVRDVDLLVYSDAGDRLASDEAPDPRAAVMICPPHPRRVFVAARLVTGPGMLALGVMPVPAPRADAVAKAVGVRGRPGEDTGKLSAWPGLEKKIRDRRAAIGSRWDDLRRVALPLDPRAYTTLSVVLPAKRCLDVLVTPSSEISGIEALVLAETGRVVARGKPPGRDRTFILCGAQEQTLTLLLRPRAAAGVAAIVIGRSPEGAVDELNERAWVDAATPVVPLAQALKRHHRRTKALRMKPATRLAQATLGAGAPAALQVKLTKGCSRIDVVGGTPLAQFTAELWSLDGRLLSRALGGETAALFYCGPAAKARVEVGTRERGGPVTIEARVDESPAQALLDHPLAAARLLQRLEASRGPVDVRHAAAAKVVRLDANARDSQTIEVPAGGCHQITAATAGAARGVQLRLVGKDGEATLHRGAQAASERICAGDQAMTLSLELEVASGAAKLLVLRSEVPR
ncbi:MAG: hypothetical protein JRI68_21345 [Deltaproteobacteria bacterium]|nr:hypothetical protein [Deltaproteobacteria bacterium]